MVKKSKQTEGWKEERAKKRRMKEQRKAIEKTEKKKRERADLYMRFLTKEKEEKK